MFYAILTLVMIATVLALMALLQAICARIDSRRFPAPGRLVNVAGREMHVREQGSGRPAVILESGIAASSLNWSLTQPQIAPHNAVVSYDRAGFGWSEPTRPGCSLNRISDELHELVAALELTKPYIIVAHSFGAYIVTAYTQRFAGEVGGVVLIDPLTTEEWIAPTSSQRWMLRRGVWFSRIGGVLAAFGVVRVCLWLLNRGQRQAPRRVLGLFGGKATETVQRILGELVKLPPDTVSLIRSRWSTSKFFWTMAGYIQAVPRCARELHGTPIPAHVPVTVLSGAHQPDIRLREHAVIAAHSMIGSHVTAGKSAHWIHLDEPELVAKVVREMARGLVNRTPAIRTPAKAEAESREKSLSEAPFTIPGKTRDA